MEIVMKNWNILNKWNLFLCFESLVAVFGYRKSGATDWGLWWPSQICNLVSKKCTIHLCSFWCITFLSIMWDVVYNEFCLFVLWSGGYREEGTHQNSWFLSCSISIILQFMFGNIMRQQCWLLDLNYICCGSKFS